MSILDNCGPLFSHSHSHLLTRRFALANMYMCMDVYRESPLSFGEHTRWRWGSLLRSDALLHVIEAVAHLELLRCEFFRVTARSRHRHRAWRARAERAREKALLYMHAFAPLR